MLSLTHSTLVVVVATSSFAPRSLLTIKLMSFEEVGKTSLVTTRQISRERSQHIITLRLAIEFNCHLPRESSFFSTKNDSLFCWLVCLATKLCVSYFDTFNTFVRGILNIIIFCDIIFQLTKKSVCGIHLQ